MHTLPASHPLLRPAGRECQAAVLLEVRGEGANPASIREGWVDGLMAKFRHVCTSTITSTLSVPRERFAACDLPDKKVKSRAKIKHMDC
eukprot:scaffold79389_cov32-Prasinocladus_malaysianus.AAC.1